MVLLVAWDYPSDDGSDGIWESVLWKAGTTQFPVDYIQ